VLDLFGIDLFVVRRWTGEKRWPQNVLVPRE
jgi:hypothetical protein